VDTMAMVLDTVVLDSLLQEMYSIQV